MTNTSWCHIKKVAEKEQTLFFASPVAYLFIAAFAGLSLFIVFWGESFFARNIADARPLFEWMPVLLIFLASALTMRLWSEERRTGTLEHVLTTPVSIFGFVIGKFLACLSLLACALLVTVPFPITVSILGDLDWGPVLAGYLATFLLGSSYIAIGLFVSSRSSNQIVALLGSVAVGGIFYLVGSPQITDVFGQHYAEMLKLLGTGSRFESITRGVVDIRDLAYYAGLIITFLTLNSLALESERWTKARKTERQKNWSAVAYLLVLNAVGLNLWLGQLRVLRVDVTEGHQYSLSETTAEELTNLKEPLLIRGYFSQKTHPLLAPLVPQLKDTLKEYEALAPGKVRVEIIDPQENPELEQEAKQEFGIQPVPFQVADRYEAAIVSSYFDVVLKYGDSFETLGFKDLIEIKGHAMENIDVHLRNPEYDITRAVKKVVDSYQKEGKLLDTLSEPLKLQFVLSEESSLPEKLQAFRKIVVRESEELQKESNGKIEVEFYDPQKDTDLVERYGLRPMATSLLDTNRFYFYILAAQGDKVIQIPIDDATEGSFERNFNAALKRFGSGFAKTVALATKGTGSYTKLRAFLGEELNIETEDLSDGSVSGAADILLLMPNEKLEAKEIYALDQFMMRGGTVIASTSPFKVTQSTQELKLEKQEIGLDKWLSHHGVSVKEQLVQDQQCAALPIPVTRFVGGYQRKEIRLLDYPFFVDVRQSGFAKNPILSDLAQLTVSWGSPIEFKANENDTLKATELLKSSDASWVSNSTLIMPQLDPAGRTVINPVGEQKPRTLGLLVEGTFKSYFETGEGKTLSSELEGLDSAIISESPDSAKLIVFSSPSMFSDPMLQLFVGMGAGDALSNLTLLANTIDWAAQDESLLTIRSRSHFKRTLHPLNRKQQMMWEYFNYIAALLLLGIIAGVQRYRTETKRDLYASLLGS